MAGREEGRIAEEKKSASSFRYSVSTLLRREEGRVSSAC